MDVTTVTNEYHFVTFNIVYWQVNEQLEQTKHKLHKNINKQKQKTDKIKIYTVICPSTPIKHRRSIVVLDAAAVIAVVDAKMTAISNAFSSTAVTAAWVGTPDSV